MFIKREERLAGFVRGGLGNLLHYGVTYADHGVKGEQ